MKKISLICLALLLSVFTSAFGQKSSDLVGIWQLCNNGTEVRNASEIQPCHIWKVIYKNKKFCQYWSWNDNNVCTVTHEGTYKFKKNNVYVEHIKSHAFDEGIVGTETVINYEFLNDDLVVFTFKLANKDKQYKELWSRVKMDKNLF